MSAKRKSSVRTSPSRDEAPEITDSWVAEADLRRGTKLVRRGRPKLVNPRRLLSLRLPPNVIASWKASGPGWQTRMAEVLEKSTPRSRRHAG
ncbi:MAG: BrnA antitoxin family protein [Burkholderiales bacterium]